MRQALATRFRFPSLVPGVGILGLGLVLAADAFGDGPTGIRPSRWSAR